LPNLKKHFLHRFLNKDFAYLKRGSNPGRAGRAGAGRAGAGRAGAGPLNLASSFLFVDLDDSPVTR